MGHATSSTPLTNVPTGVGTPDPAREDRELLRRLAKLWKSHHVRDLGVRWKTGELLNRRLGPPTARLSHGRRVLKRAAERLQVAESDLSRMRWFAHLFKSAEDLQGSHPDVRSWTK